MRDFVIIGQGLAGSILALQLIERGADVMVLDHPQANSASRVAAGIINPVTGHRLNITEGFEKFWPTAQEFYRHWETQLGVQLFKPIPQRRLIKNRGQFDFLQQRLTQAAYRDILGHYDESAEHFVAGEHFGAIEVLCTALVNSAGLVDATREWLQRHNRYQSCVIEHSDIDVSDTGFAVAGIAAKQLIFCEGARAIDNPWLAHLPFAPAKGEVVRVSTESHTDGDQLLNWGTWLAPSFSPGVHKLGSTYVWDDFTPTPDAARINKLLKSAGERCAHPLTVIDSSAGVRPSTSDRKPIIGALASLPGAWCFNGFGSKGCLLIPWHATELCDPLLNSDHQPTPTELCLPH